jgi:hypothetical protein
MFCSCKVAIRGARTIATDDVLAHGIIKELQRRGVDPAHSDSPRHDTPNPDQQHVVLEDFARESLCDVIAGIVEDRIDTRCDAFSLPWNGFTPVQRRQDL